MFEAEIQLDIDRKLFGHCIRSEMTMQSCGIFVMCYLYLVPELIMIYCFQEAQNVLSNSCCSIWLNVCHTVCTKARFTGPTRVESSAAASFFFSFFFAWWLESSLVQTLLLPLSFSSE